MWCNQIFSLIIDDTIHNIIVCDNYEIANQIAKTQYGAAAFALDTTQYPVSIGYKYKDGIFYTDDAETVVQKFLTTDEEVKIARTKIDWLESLINPKIESESCSITELKLWQIKKSKSNLEEYLEQSTIYSKVHNDIEKQYTITREKQVLLSQMINMTQRAIEAGVEFHPNWNAKGEQSSYGWTLEQLQQLSLEIELFIRPLVIRQQDMENEIRLASTKEEILSINIEF